MKGHFKTAASFSLLVYDSLLLRPEHEKVGQWPKKVPGARNKQAECVERPLISKLPKQIFWRFTVTHVSSGLLQHTHCPALSLCVCVILARAQHSSTASV